MNFNRFAAFAILTAATLGCSKRDKNANSALSDSKSEASAIGTGTKEASNLTSVSAIASTAQTPSIWNSYIESGMLTSAELGSGNLLIDAQGNTYHAATFSSPAYAQTPNFPRWPLITKRGPTGNILWSKHLGKEYTYSYDASSKSIIRSTPDGGIVVTMTFTKAPFTGSGSRSPNAVVTKLSADGVVLWTTSIAPPASPAATLVAAATHRTLLGISVHHIDGFIYLFGEDCDSNKSAGFVATLNKDGVPVNTQYLNLPISTAAGKVTPVEIFSRSDRSVILFVNYALADDAALTTNLTERLFVIVSGPALQLRIQSFLIGSAIPVSPPTAASNIRASMVSRKPNSAFPIYNEATNSIVELPGNFGALRNNIVLGATKLFPQSMFPHRTSNFLYLFSRLDARDPDTSLWPPAHIKADGHIFALDVANQPTEARYVGVNGAVSSAGGLRSGVADAAGNYVIATSHGGANGMTLSVAGIQAVERRQFRSVMIGTSQFDVESSAPCTPLGMQISAAPRSQVATFGFLPPVPLTTSRPNILASDAIDVVWRWQAK